MIRNGHIETEHDFAFQLQITFFFRAPQAGAFSMEELFHALAEQLRQMPEPFQVQKVTLPHPSNSMGNLLRNLFFVRRHRQQIGHIIGDVHYLALVLRPRRFVLTVHDCGFVHKYSRRHPKYWFIKWFWFDLPVRLAGCVTTVSEKSKAELTQLTGIDPGRVTVIPNFVKPLFRPAEKPFDPERLRILFIGATPNKNLAAVLEALEGQAGITLVIIGQVPEKQLFALRAKKIAFEWHTDLSHEEVARQYHSCDLLLFPSLYEGFGMPILEAQASGVPVITSDRSPMREVAGAAAILVDPESPEDIRLALERLRADAGLRARLRESGLANARQYDLESVARQYGDLYQSLCEKDEA